MKRVPAHVLVMFSISGFGYEEDGQPSETVIIGKVTVEEDDDRSVVAAELTVKDGSECEQVPED